MGVFGLDKQQQSAVDCNRNAVVSAGAGSGKTTVLSRRYVRLVTEGKGTVESILTLTFTRKAAAEMYERIYRELLSLKNNPAAAEQAARFEKARISTLDSFSAEIVRNGAYRYGIPAEFTTDNDKVKILAEQSALDFILRRQNNRFLKEFINLHGFENVLSGLFVSIAVERFIIGEPIDFSVQYRLQKDKLLEVIQEKRDKIEELRKRIASMPPGKGKSYSENIRICSEADSLDGIEDLKEIQRIVSSLNLNLRMGKGADDQILKEFIIELREEKAVLFTAVGSLESMPLIKGMFDLLEDFQSEILSQKRRQGLLSFQDVAALSVKILLEDLELRRFYKNQFTHIMIDEFQDNNRLQKDLLFLLAEKKGIESSSVPSAGQLDSGKLFFVGDEKQSIYSFRDADVSVFKKLKDELTSSGGEFISLNTNYRSEPALIDFFNRFFDRVFENARAPYEAVFEPLKSRTPVEGITPSIRFYFKPYDPGPGTDTLPPGDAEAYHTALVIRRIVEEKELLVPGENGTLRPAGYNDIALLMRSTSRQIKYEKYFRRLNIPFTVDSVRALFMEAPINDLYNFLQLLVYPGDRSAYAALLRSPFINLSDGAVTSILLREDSAFELEEDQFEGLYFRNNDKARYLNAKRLYLRLRDMRDRVPKTRLIRSLWYESGYRYLLMKNKLYEGYLEYYDYLVELAERSDSAGENLALFLDFIRSNLGNYEKLDDLTILRAEDRGVHFMTVHKSKGLEFPVVIVADTGSAGRGVEEKRPYFFSREYGISLKAGGEGKSCENYFFSIAKSENTDKLIAEIKRVLYVALTRAETHLILSGVQGKTNSNPDSETGRRTVLNIIKRCIPDDTYKEIIPDYREEDTVKVRGGFFKRDTETARKIYEEMSPPERYIERAVFSATELVPDSGISSGGEEGKSLPQIDSDGIIQKNGLERAFGIFCHKIIESRIKGISFEAQEFVQFSGLPEKERKVLIRDGLSLASNFLDSSFAKSLTDSAVTESEISFVLKRKQNGKTIFINGQADLAAVTADEVVVVDFKTDQQMNSREYSAQLYVYRTALSEIYGKPARSYLFYLRSGEEVEVKEEIGEFIL